MNFSDMMVENKGTTAYVDEWARQHASAKPGLLFLGASLMQMPALILARRMGVAMYVCDGNDAALCRNMGRDFFHIDLKDIHALAEKALDLKAKGLIHGVLTVGTDFSASVAYVAEQCDFPGIGYENALNASRKHRMRAVFAAEGLPSPGCLKVSREQINTDMQRIPQQLNFPLVVKPSDNMGARGVMEAGNSRELESALNQALSYSPGGIAVAEEKIVGIEYSLDSLVSDSVLYPMGIARRHINYPPYFIERGHSFPSLLDKEAEHSMFDVLKRAASALGIKNGAAKGDIFYTEKGPVIGEIAARLSGGYMSGWSYPMYSDVHPTVGAIQIALGEGISDPAGKRYFTGAHRHSLEHEVHEKSIISIAGIVEEVIEPQSDELCFFFPYVFPGDRVRFPRNNAEKCGNFIIRADAASAESCMSAAFVRLKAVSLDELEQTLKQDFPPAYPKAHALLIPQTERLSLQDSVEIFALPANIIESMERDWNYRTVRQSLDMLSQMPEIISFEYRVIDEQAVVTAQGMSLLYALVKGGLQAALYYLEILQSNSEEDNRGQIFRFEDLIVE